VEGREGRERIIDYGQREINYWVSQKQQEKARIFGDIDGVMSREKGGGG